MSVDQRIREGLAMLDQKLPPPDTDSAYDQIVHGAETETTRRRGVVTGLAAAAAVAAVLVWTDGGIPGARPDVGPVDDPTVPAFMRVDEAADIAGTWRSRGPVEIGVMAANVASYGDMTQDLRRLFGSSFDPPGAMLDVRFAGGFVYLRADGVEVDRRSYSVDADGTVWVRPMTSPGGRSQFTAVIRDGLLHLRFVDTNVPPHDDVREEVVVGALYTTVSFERVPE
jgi:hypothetical protein